MPVVAGRARNRNAQLPALLREGRRRPRSVHSAEWPDEDASHDLPEMEQVGETMKDEELFSRRGGVMMPHVVSPEVAEGEETAPPVLPKQQTEEASKLDHVLTQEERKA